MIQCGEYEALASGTSRFPADSRERHRVSLGTGKVVRGRSHIPPPERKGGRQGRAPPPASLAYSDCQRTTAPLGLDFAQPSRRPSCLIPPVSRRIPRPSRPVPRGECNAPSGKSLAAASTRRFPRHEWPVPRGEGRSEAGEWSSGRSLNMQIPVLNSILRGECSIPPREGLLPHREWAVPRKESDVPLGEYSSRNLTISAGPSPGRARIFARGLDSSVHCEDHIRLRQEKQPPGEARGWDVL